jgi:hypothetical protein
MQDSRADFTRQIASLARPLRNAARALESVAIIGAIAGAALGVVVAASETTTFSAGFDGLEPGTQHPYVALGIAIVLEALLSGWFFWAVARGLQLLAVDTADRHGIDLDPVRAAEPTNVQPAMPGHPAGWYPDQLIADPASQWRWWNGTQWTSETRTDPPD